MGAVDTNPPNSQIHITDHGSDWLWAVFAIMAVSTLGMFAWSHMRPRGTRFFHNIALIILLVSTIAYFSMASNLGATPIQTEFRAPGTRQIWYVRYIQWFINFPLLLIVLLFATGLAMTEILTTAFFAWVVVVCGLVGALVQSSYKWGFYVFGLFALFYIWTVLLGHGPRTTFNAGPGLRTGYIRGSGFLSFILILYPIGWAVSEGGNVISSTSEMVWYGVLDLILGPLFLFYVVFGLRNIDYNTFGLQSLKYSDTYGAAPAVVPATSATVASAGYASGHHSKAAEAGVISNVALATSSALPSATAAPFSTISPVGTVPTSANTLPAAGDTTTATAGSFVNPPPAVTSPV